MAQWCDTILGVPLAMVPLHDVTAVKPTVPSRSTNRYNIWSGNVNGLYDDKIRSLVLGMSRRKNVLAMCLQETHKLKCGVRHLADDCEGFVVINHNFAQPGRRGRVKAGVGIILPPHAATLGW